MESKLTSCTNLVFARGLSETAGAMVFGRPETSGPLVTFFLKETPKSDLQKLLAASK